MTQVTHTIHASQHAARARSHVTHASVPEVRGAASLGLYGLHVAVLTWVIRGEWFGPAATSVPLLLIRYAAVTALTCAVVLPLRRVPWLRRVL